MELQRSKFLGFSASLLMVLSLASVTAQAQPDRQVQSPDLIPELSDDSTFSAGLVSSLSEIEFAELALGQQATRRFILTNTGLAAENPITVFSIYLDERDSLSFSTDFVGPATIYSGESIAIEVTFSPNRPGDITGTLIVSHDGESGLEIFTLSGRGSNGPAEPGQTQLDIPTDTAKLNRAAPTRIGFGKSALQGIGAIKPTSLQFGPDGKLYVADMLGVIKVYSVKRNSSNRYSVTKTDTITKIRDIPNHNDNGVRNPSIRNRLVTGLLVLGSAEDPVIYVNSSDPRIGGGPSHKDTNLDTNSSIISRLTRVGNQWVKKDLVRGLSRSEENHHLNGMAYNPVTNHLYVSAGGNTNQGGPSQNFAKLPEFALSAAILEIDLNQIGNNTYDLPTLDDQTRGGVTDNNDPFGGNNGLNQAKLVPGGPVQIYAPGFRNAYDIVITAAGNMYTIDNGPNAGWGAVPKGEGPGGNCTNGLSEPGKTFFDSLHHITSRGYYGGHANPTRGNKNNKFNARNPQSPVSQSNPVECDYRNPGAQSKALTLFRASTNGLTEYQASNFGGAMQGDLLAAAFDNKIYRLSLNNGGKSLESKTALFSNVGQVPLDVTAQSDTGIFPGTVWVADFVKRSIYVFEPSDYSDTGNGTAPQVCTGSPGHVDSDKDGYLNSDENANATDPCSAADIPADADNDKVSDLVDKDDDNDGLQDTHDPFPLDKHNGRNTDLPLSYTWENNGSNPGYLFNLGFSGLMNNGNADYQTLFDAAGITAGGAAGVLTIDNVPAGSAQSNANNQEYAFQFGIDVTPATPEFTVSTRLLAPFAGITPGSEQFMGFYIGTGDQDNYIQLVANGAEGTGAVELGIENAGHYSSVDSMSAPIKGAGTVDLYLTVNPQAGTVSAWYSVTQNGTVSQFLPLVNKVALPANWLTANTGLAVGIIASAGKAGSFTATWDHIDIFNGSVGGDQANPVTTANTTVVEVENGLARIQAEAFNAQVKTATHQWIKSTKPGAVGSAMITTPDSGKLNPSNKNSPALEYKLNFKQAGVYSVWVRGSGDTRNNEGKSDSLHVGLNGKLGTAAAIQNFPADWRWSNETRAGSPATISVPAAGIHTVNLWMREDGLAIDQFIVSADSRFSPAGSDDDNTPDDAETDTGSGSESGQDQGTGSDPDPDNTDPGNTDQGQNDQDEGTADAGAPDSGSDNQDAGARVIIEAENFDQRTSTSTHQWVAVSRSGASSGKAMTTTPDSGALVHNNQGTPKLTYNAVFAEPGTYYLWVRGYGDTDSTGEGKSDSLHVGINGKLGNAAALQNFPPRWSWSQQRRNGPSAYIKVPTAGTHAINVWMREDGLILDKLVLTKSVSDKPVNFESLPPTDSGNGTAGDTGDNDNEQQGDTGSSGDDNSPIADAQHPVVSDTDGIITLEAELFQQSTRTLSHQWVVSNRAGASAGSSMTTTPDAGALKNNTQTTPVLKYEVDFRETGTYQVWVRGWGDTRNGEGKSDSLHIGLVNAAGSAQVVDEFPAGWHWSNHRRGGGRATLKITSAGVQTVGIWMREDGMNIDQVILTRSGSYSPVDPEQEDANTGSDTDNDAGSNTGNTDNEQEPGNTKPSATTKWQKHQAISGSVIARHEAAGVVFKGKLYVMGGRGNRATSVFDPAKNQWTVKSSPPVQMNHFQAVALGDKIYVLGAFQGNYPDETAVPTIYSYNPATDKWKAEGTMPQARRRGSAGVAVYQNRIYIVGGNTKGHRRGAVNWFDVYDPATGKWTTLTSAPTARDHIQVSVANGKLVVAAGRQSDYPRSVWGNMQSAVDVYDFASKKWQQENAIPTLRSGAMAVTVGSEVLIIGGETDRVLQARNQVEAFDVQTNQWRALKPLNIGRHGGAAGLIGNQVHVVTGNTTIGGGHETTSHETLRTH